MHAICNIFQQLGHCKTISSTRILLQIYLQWRKLQSQERGRSWIILKNCLGQDTKQPDQRSDIPDSILQIPMLKFDFQGFNYTPEETKRLLKKIDLRLLPLLTVLYVLSFMDRSNIGNARVAGMNADLGLTGPQYNIALTVFFFPYGLFEVPSNVVLKIMRPSRWIAILVVSWGTVRILSVRLYLWVFC